MMVENNKTFMKITNKDISDKLVDIEHHVIRTNGKVRLGFWMATTAISLTVVIIYLLFNHIGKGG